jgi:hypothetical protein
MPNGFLAIMSSLSSDRTPIVPRNRWIIRR